MLSPDELAKYEELRGIVARLRAPGGCPWDREQTHASLRPYVIEEAYEVLAALDAGEIDKLPEELGDLMIQVLLHTAIAEEAGEFTMNDVLGGLSGKLVRRHPHVFGDVELETADEVNTQWDKIKSAERAGRATEESALDSVPSAMPALSYANTLLRRAESAGFAWPDKADVLDKLTEEIGELAATTSKEEAMDELGDILLNVVNYARYLNLDAEEALRTAGHKFRRRFVAVETMARERDIDMKQQSRDTLMALWAEAKTATDPPINPGA